jgi:RNA 2',3'-cyclic 3'-phosphodiesterase
MRLFFAITFPESLKDSLAHVATQLQGQLHSGNWTRRDNYHLTLVFLGNMSPGQLASAKEVLHQQIFAPFSISCSGLGRFQKGNRDIWWMGLKPSVSLARLHHSLFAVLWDSGFALEDRPYQPHLTLAREVSTPKDFHPVPELDRSKGLVIPVTSLSLMESVRVDGQLVYREIDRQPASG